VLPKLEPVAAVGALTSLDHGHVLDLAWYDSDLVAAFADQADGRLGYDIFVIAPAVARASGMKARKSLPDRLHDDDADGIERSPSGLRARGSPP
jgi:hypothetical protein